MDMRTNNEFEISHIKHEMCISVPATDVPPGVTSRHIENILPVGSKEWWDKRGIVDYVVILDWHSSVSLLQNPKPTPVKSLKDAMFKWDSSVILKSEPLVLEGGYDEWLLRYPMLSTNANVSRPQINQSSERSIASLEHIDYDLDFGFLSPPKKEVQNNMPDSNIQPVVDRSKKPVFKSASQPDTSAISNNHIANGIREKTLNDTNLSVRNQLSHDDVDLEEKIDNVTRASNMAQDMEKNGIEGNKSAMPAVNRALKPNVIAKSKTIPSSENLDTDISALTELAEVKHNELKRFQKENTKLIAERRARKAKLEQDRKEVQELENKKKQELKETTELMRKRKQIEEELRKLEEEKALREEEERKRVEELANLKVEESRKEEIRKEADKLRQERKVQEDMKKQEEMAKLEIEKKEKEKPQPEGERRKAETMEKEKEEKRRQEGEAEMRKKKLTEPRTNETVRTTVGKAHDENQSRLETSKVEDPPSSPGLPVGWEKRLDPSTGRYFYIDHTTRTKHLQPPSHLANAKDQQGGTYKIKLQDKEDVPSGGLKRSHSSPNIAKLLDEEDIMQQRRLHPSVDRAAKPKSRQEPLPIKTEVSAAKVRNLQPTWGNVASGLTGLRNMGNTCYMNSIVQCLSCTTPVVQYFLSDSYRLDINRENFLGTGGNLAEEFAVLVKALWAGQYRSVTPRDFKHTVGRYNPMFSGYDQHDAQELLLFLMDGLHEDLNRVVERPKIPEQQNDGVRDDIAAERAWSQHKSINQSIIVELFQGLFKSTVKCLSCHKESVTFDVFMYLSLPIPSSTRCSLKECLLEFAKEEKMTGASQWQCPRCKCKRDAIKRMVIWKLPHILLIHLKRFYYQGMWRQKITANVDFPVDQLDLQHYIAGPKKRAPYDLYAVSNHYGTMEGGHYTAYCRNPNKHKWFKFDDHEVYDMSMSDVKSSAGFILFYSCIKMDALNI